jgi:hypothetical protein
VRTREANASLPKSAADRKKSMIGSGTCHPSQETFIPVPAPVHREMKDLRSIDRCAANADLTGHRKSPQNIIQAHAGERGGPRTTGCLDPKGVSRNHEDRKVRCRALTGWESLPLRQIKPASRKARKIRTSCTAWLAGVAPGCSPRFVRNLPWRRSQGNRSPLQIVEARA